MGGGFFRVSGFELSCGLVDIEQSVETIAQMLETADSQVAFASSSAAELFAQEADMPKLPLVPLAANMAFLSQAC